MNPSFSGIPAHSGLVKQSYIRRNICTFLSDMLPNRIKRLLFSASLYGLLEKNQEEKESVYCKIKKIFFITKKDKQIVEKLNAELKLGQTSDSSLVFPMIVKSLIWTDLKKSPYFEIDHQKIDFRDIEKIKAVDPDLNYFTLFVISQMPIWLVYGSFSLIHHDICMLVSSLN